MSSEKSSESKVSFTESQIQQALKLCRDMTRDHVLQMITTGIDITLRTLEASRSSATAEYLVLLNQRIREIQEKAPEVRDRYTRNFEQWFDSGESPLARNTADSVQGGGGLSLSLLDTEALEQQIIVERMAAGAATETQAQHTLLNRRFGFLKDEQIKPVDSPIGPYVLGKLLIDALEAIEVSADNRILGLRVMEQNFPEALGDLYSSLNQKLIEMGVLPEIKHEIVRTADTLRGGRGQSGAGMAESQRQVLEDRRREENAEVMGSLLKDFLVYRSSDLHQGNDESPSKSFLKGSEQLLNMLNSMGDEHSSNTLLERLDAKAEELGEAKPPSVVRETLHLLDKLCIEFQKPFRKNPNSQQAQLAKNIGTPLAKLAVIDSDFLEQPAHPVREALRHLRLYADALETRDAEARSSISVQFEAFVTEFKLIATKTFEEQQDYAERLGTAVREIKERIQENIGKVHHHHIRLEELADSWGILDQLIQAQAESFNLSPEAQRFLIADGLYSMHQFAVGEDFRWPDEKLAAAIQDLLALLSGNRSVEGLVFARLESLRLNGVIDRLQILVGSKSMPESGATGSLEHAETEGSVDQLAAQNSWYGSKIKSGAWLWLFEQNADARLCCRLYRVYQSGNCCVFVDGLGMKIAEYTAQEVRVALEQERIQLAP